MELSGGIESGAMSSGAVFGSSDWMHEFQEKYLKEGIENTEAQSEYLLRLAKHYEDKYDKTKNWVDFFKVSNFSLTLVHTFCTF